MRLNIFLEQLIKTDFKTPFLDLPEYKYKLSKFNGSTTTPIYKNPYDAEITKIFKIQKDIMDDDNKRVIKGIFDFVTNDYYIFSYFASHYRVMDYLNIDDGTVAFIFFDTKKLELLPEPLSFTTMKKRIKTKDNFKRFNDFKIISL